MPHELLNLSGFHFFLRQVRLLRSEIVLGLESDKQTCSGNVNCPLECQTILFLNQLQETTSRGSMGKLIFFLPLVNQTPPRLDVVERLPLACGAAAGGPSLEPSQGQERRWSDNRQMAEGGRSWTPWPSCVLTPGPLLCPTMSITSWAGPQAPGPGRLPRAPRPSRRDEEALCHPRTFQVGRGLKVT